MDEYERDKVFLGLMTEALFGDTLTPEVHPLRVLEAMEARSPAKAKRGLRLAVNDLVEDTMELSPEQVAGCDAALREIGGTTLSAMRARYSKAVAGIEKRGRIRNEPEAHLVKGLLDGDVDALSLDRRERLQSLFEAYEASIGDTP